jgi:uncharacterized surface protein with fasciclin (FAS1) repeats
MAHGARERSRVPSGRHATIIAADVLATNGVIRVIDKVLVPPTG